MSNSNIFWPFSNSSVYFPIVLFQQIGQVIDSLVVTAQTEFLPHPCLKNSVEPLNSRDFELTVCRVEMNPVFLHKVKLRIVEPATLVNVKLIRYSTLVKK